MRKVNSLTLSVGRVSLKFLAVSIINFFVGFIIFLLAWLTLSDHLNYLPIAILSTLFAAVFSFQTHNRITLERQSIKNFVSAQYLTFQVISLLIGSVTVPTVAAHTHLNLLVVQLFWTLLLSVVGLIVIIRSST
jgi:uncharacterized membrane protein YiaA